MIWLVTIALGAWVWWLTARLSQTRAMLRDLSHRLAPAAPLEDVAPEPWDMPVAPIPEPVAVIWPLSHAPEAPAPAEPMAAPEAAIVPSPRLNLGDLLAEKGLAWLGGGALVLGGIFLVGYAAQRGLFTPPVRLAAAVLAAGLMLIGSELFLRLAALRNRLVAAILAGAGAGALYATVWAAHGLYHYVPAAPAAALLTAISALMLALALRHREPLALLALLGAFAPPLLTGHGSDSALSLQLIGVSAAGLAVAAWRGWGRTALATVIGATTLNLFNLSGDSGVWLSISAVAISAMALGFAARRRETSGRAGGATAPTALALCSIGLVLVWNASSLNSGAPEALGLLILMTGLAARLGWIRPETLIAPVALSVMIASTRLFGATGHMLLDPNRLAVLGLAAASLLAGVVATRRLAAVVIATLGTLALLAASADRLDPTPAGLLALAGALALALAAWNQALRSEEASRDWSLDAWSLAAGLALLLAIRLGARTDAAPVLEAAAALGLALIQRRLGWRGLMAAALAAGGAAATSLLGPSFITTGLATAPGAGLAVAACAAAAVLLPLAGRTLRLADDIVTPRQALTAGGVGAALIGAFLGLRWCASGQGIGLSLLLEASLRTLLLAMSGASMLLILRDLRGPIARFGPLVLLSLAAAHGLITQLTLLNPWWGVWPSPIEPLPLLNVLAVGYLAPALAFALAARRIYGRDRVIGHLLTGTAIVFALAWLFLTIRNIFHGPVLDQGAVPYAEIIADGLILPLLALGLTLAGRRGRQAGADFQAAAQALLWLGLPLGLYLAGFQANPWWGPSATDLGGPGLGMVAGLGLTVLAGVNWVSGRAARPLHPRLAEAALVMAGLHGLVLATLAVRWAFHPIDLQLGAGRELETWTYSAVWAVAGAGLLALGSALRERGLRWLGLLTLLGVAAKVVIFDMANLEGIVRAASFLAVGVLMVGAAVAARRLAGGGREP